MGSRAQGKREERNRLRGALLVQERLQNESAVTFRLRRSEALKRLIADASVALRARLGSARRSGLSRKYGHTACVELRGVGLMLAAREHVHLVGHHDIDESGEGQDLPPLCIQQSTGNSATPEVDVVFRLLGNLPMHEDVGNLNSPARLEHAVHLAKDGLLVRTEIDDAVADHHVSRRVLHRQ